MRHFPKGLWAEYLVTRWQNICRDVKNEGSGFSVDYELLLSSRGITVTG